MTRVDASADDEPIPRRFDAKLANTAVRALTNPPFDKKWQVRERRRGLGLRLPH